ncbi:hypothetical protein N9934_03075, partial [Desulfosarcina sp.]|nr:hypothetical protein [Desulfosarcina sp.]
VATKNQQISNQYDKITEIEKFIPKVESEIAMTNLFNSFEFQATPTGTIEYLFMSAKTKDYTKVRFLLDPYGEFNDDAMGLCLVDMYPSEAQNEWNNEFKNGRIIGDPIIKDEIAEIEIAIGPESDELEKINLVKRMKKWYIISYD